jgi:hypothetical protein
MTDIVEIEAQKENVLPLSSGRSASKLAGLLSRDRKSLDADLKREHQRFQQEIATVDIDPDVEDPLDVYHRSVRSLLRMLGRVVYFSLPKVHSMDFTELPFWSFSLFPFGTITRTNHKKIRQGSSL